jgi:hypothetical protein
MAWRNAVGVVMESGLGVSGTSDAVGSRCVPLGSGIERAFVISERDMRGTRAHRRKPELKMLLIAV